jgi:RNA polymerase sigma-70 factor (ECF subfamily)
VPLEIDDFDRHAARESLIDRAAGPSDIVLGQERTEALERAVLALPDNLRAAFVLRDIEVLSTREAAAALGIAESALKVRLHRARAALRGMLAPMTDYRCTESSPLPSEVELRLLDQVCPPSAPRSIPEG